MPPDLVLPVAYLPPVSWWAWCAARPAVWLDDARLYRKQTLMNRAYIKGSNNVNVLPVPILRAGKYGPMREAVFKPDATWHREHTRTLVSAYGRSAYFEYLWPELLPLFEAEALFPLNMGFIHWLKNFLRLPTAFYFTSETPAPADALYYPPKRPDAWQQEPYYQPFGAFEPDLSALDLVFHLGPEAGAYVRRAAVML